MCICIRIRQEKMAAGLRGQAGVNARDIAGQDYRPESGSAQTRHPVMAERNAWDLLNNIKIVCFIGAQVIIDVVTLSHKLTSLLWQTLRTFSLVSSLYSDSQQVL